MTGRLLSILGLAGCIAASNLDAQEPVQTFRSSVDVVPVRASVRDSNGRPIRGLVQHDFMVSDNGQQRPIRTFHADVAAPITAAFLVDVSGSMSTSNKMTLAHDVLEHAFQAMRPGEDEAALFTFDTRVDERQPFTRDFRNLASILLKIEPFGATSLYDMVAHTGQTGSGHALSTRRARRGHGRLRHEQHLDPWRSVRDCQCGTGAHLCGGGHRDVRQSGGQGR